MLAYAVRHAESRSNTGEDVGLDSDLTDLGRSQAEALVHRFRGVPIDALYTSPFSRCLQSVLPIANVVGVPARLRPELFEFHHLAPGTAPDFQLHPAATIAARYENVIVDPDLEVAACWPPLDESREQLVHRMGSFAAALKQRWTDPGAIVLIISHGSPISRLIDAWLDDDHPRSFRYIIDNAAVTALRFQDDVSSLICLNETSHLRGLAAPAAADYDALGNIKPVSTREFW